VTRFRGRVAAAGAVAVALAAAGCAREADAPPPPVSVPEGTPLSVALDQALTTRIHRAGDPFVATVREAVMVDGRVAIAAGSSLQGRVRDARSGARSATPALTLAFTRVVDPEGVASPVEVRPLHMEGAAPDAAPASVRNPLLGDEIGPAAPPAAFVAVSEANEIELPIGQRLLLEIAAPSAVAAAAPAGTDPS
jgi:hypothetical protein